ncbi:MAG: TonB-dependent receptor [Bacteroidetes bacterium]|nr:TonB-dependent receptor [Bacteroidota bacterium]
MMQQTMKIKFIKRLALLLLFSFYIQFSYAQEKSISGRVLDFNTGESLPGANIIVKGTNNGTTSDFDGFFKFNISDDDKILLVSFIGYEIYETPIDNRSNYIVRLKSQDLSIDEVVVIGYGSVKKSDLTGSVSSVKGDDLTKIPAASIEQSLHGKVAGLQVSNISGAPGSIPVLRIRGVGTLNNSSPIFVVDGIILDDISFLNSADIESIEVLKDASATAIYGSRGANGVIIITSKSGKSGEGTTFNFSSEYSMQFLQKRIDLLSGSEFARVVNQINPGTFNNIDLVANTDWQNQVFENNTPLLNIQFSFSGSTKDKYNYYFGVGYFDQQGVIPKSDYNRITAKLNQTYFFTKKIKIGSNLSLSSEKRNNAANVISQIYRAWPSSLPINEDGSFAEVNGSGNPLASISYNNSNYDKLRSVGNLYADFKFLKYFVFKSSIGFDLGYGKSKNFAPIYYVSPTQQNVTNDLTVYNDEFFTWLWENTLNFDYSIENHNINILGGYTMQKMTFENLGGSVQNLSGNDPSLWYLNAGETPTQRSFNSGSASSMISYLFRANYSYSSKYLITASLRSDGSSKFSKSNRFGYFPSFALGWNLSKEDFFPKNKIMEKLKLRASWGKIGNEKIPQNERFALVSNVENAVFGIDEKLIAGASLGNTANPNLRWETTTQTDIGVEMGFLKDKIKAEIDFFDRKTEDILVGVSIPGYFGNGAFVRVITNAADIRNQGVEFNLGLHSNIGNIKASFNANGSIIKNEVLKLASTTGDDSFISGGNLSNGQQVTRTEVGEPIGSFYGYEVIGIIQNQNELDNSAIVSGQEIGDLKFKDIDNNGIIDAADRTYLGSPIPDFIFGFSTSLKYKQLSLTIDLQGQTGNKIYNGKNAVRPDLYNFESRVKDRWHGEGTSNSEPRATASGANYSASSYFIEDGSFLRLRNVSLQYSFKPESLSKFKISQLNVYIKGTNLYTISKFSGYSPEIGSNDVISSGIDFGSYPVTAVISFGMSCKF